MMSQRSRAIVAIILVCAAQAVARKPSRRQLEKDLVFEKKGRASRKEAVLFHTYDEAWNAVASDLVSTQTEMDIDCIRRHGKGNGKGRRKGAGKVKSKSKKSKSSTYFCPESGGVPSEESAPVSVPTSPLVPTPVAFPSSESVDNPSTEGVPLSASAAPSVPALVAFTSAPTVPAPISYPSADNNAVPSTNSDDIPSTEAAPSVQIPVAFPSAPPDFSSPSTAPSLVRTPAPSAGPSTPIINEDGDITSENSLVSVCEAFFTGTAPTSGPELQFEAKLDLLLDGTVSTRRVLVNIHAILTGEVAPAILGCSRLNPGESGRKVQEVVSGLRNIVFAVQTEDRDVPGVANISGSVYYIGPYPEGIFDALRRAILSSDILGIPGLAGFGHNFEFREAQDAPSDPPADDGILGGIESQGNIRESERRIGAFVGVVTAGMVAALSLILAAGASRRRHSIGRHLKHQKLEDISTDDESNPYSLSDHDTSPDDGEDMWFANIIDEQDSGIISWGSQTPPVASRRYPSSYYPSKGMQFEEGLQYHHCTGPDCTLCLAETRTRFSHSAIPNKSSSRFRKEYLVHDTVVL